MLKFSFLTVFFVNFTFLTPSLLAMDEEDSGSKYRQQTPLPEWKPVFIKPRPYNPSQALPNESQLGNVERLRRLSSLKDRLPLIVKGRELANFIFSPQMTEKRNNNFSFAGLSLSYIGSQEDLALIKQAIGWIPFSQLSAKNKIQYGRRQVHYQIYVGQNALKIGRKGAPPTEEREAILKFKILGQETAVPFS